MKYFVTVFFVLTVLPHLLLAQNYTWTEKVSGVTSPLYGASEGIDPHNFWVCGANGVVLRTTNGGDTWILKNSGIPSNLNLVTISDARGNNIAVTAGNIGSTTYAYRTTNGGANWTQVFSQDNGKINAIYMPGGFMTGNPVGGRWSIWKSTNGGLIWDSSGMFLSQDNGESGWNNSLEMKQCGNDFYIWMGTNNYRIYLSTDFGMNWSAIATGSVKNIFSIHMDDWINFSGHGYAGGSNLLATELCGTSWDTVSAPGTGDFGGLTFGVPGAISDLNPDLFSIFAVRSSNKIYYTLPGENTWHEYTSPSGTYNYIRGPSQGPFVAVRNDGGISWYCCMPGGVKRIGTELPRGFSLSQNYPNPFNPSTNVRYEIPRLGDVRLAIFDILGKEIGVLINQKQSPGTYEVEWDGSNYPSGVYFYQLTAGNFSETRKMVLIR